MDIASAPVRVPSSALEALNTDVIILILSAVGSLKDLGALIHASPILYHDFLSAKTLILLRVGADNLGPAIRDAVILAYIEMEPFVNDEDYYDRVEQTLDIYRLRLLQEKKFWTMGISTQTAVWIVRLNRTTQYFVDLYICIRLAYFERNLYPPCHWEATVTERYQITQAFVRYQIIVKMFCTDSITPYDKNFLLARTYALFEAWEIEQVSQLDPFIFLLCNALAHCEKLSDGSRPIHRIEYAMREASRDAMPRGVAMLPRSGSVDGYYKRNSSNLSIFRAALLEAAAVDAELMREIMGYPNLSNSKANGMNHSFLCARQKPMIRHKTPSPPPPPPSVPCNLVSESPVDTPWGWTVAMGERDDDSWGMDLVPGGPRSDQWMKVKDNFNLWRWLGLVFWDPARVEAINNTELMAEIEPGWLARPWG